MSKELKQFIIKILVASFALVATGWMVFSYFAPDQYLPVLPWMLAFFALFTVLIHSWQINLAKKKDTARFTRSNMIASLLRLVTYSGFAIVFLINHAENISAFVVCIVTVYLVFSFLEVTDLARISRKKK